MSHAEQEFRAAIAAAGLAPPDNINADGKIHRFGTNGKPRDDSGWYMLHLDGIAAGAFGCWREGLQSNWCAESDTSMTPAEREAQRRRIDAMKAQRDADTAERRAAAAAQRLQVAKPCTQHDYLTPKGVQPHGVRIDAAGALLVPMRDTAGTLHSLQSIAPDGEKRFMPGGRVKG